MHMPQVSYSGEPNEHSHNALLHVVFPIVLQGRHLGEVISELNGWPVIHPAIGALPLLIPPLRDHSINGHRRIARGHDGSTTPFMWGSFIPDSMPVYPGAFRMSSLSIQYLKYDMTLFFSYIVTCSFISDRLISVSPVLSNFKTRF